MEQVFSNRYQGTWTHIIAAVPTETRGHRRVMAAVTEDMGAIQDMVVVVAVVAMATAALVMETLRTIITHRTTIHRLRIGTLLPHRLPPLIHRLRTPPLRMGTIPTHTTTIPILLLRRMEEEVGVLLCEIASKQLEEEQVRGPSLAVHPALPTRGDFPLLLVND